MAAISTENLYKAYLAYFGRPPDVTGLEAFKNATEAQVIAAFSASQESIDLYSSVDTANQINAIYNNLFNRDAEPAGLVYWLGQLNSGAFTLAEMAFAVLKGAQGTDAQTVANKVIVMQDFVSNLDTSAEILGYAGNDAAQSARDFLKTVSYTTGSLTTALAGVDAAITAAINADDVANAQTYTLTSSASSVNEGGEVFFNLATTNVAPGTVLSYTINGVSAADVVGGVLTGTVTTDAFGKAVIAVSLVADLTSEGAETLTVNIAGQTKSVTVADTSLTPDAVLTTGNDLVNTGLGDDTIIGNSSTYNSGDEIDGGEGADTLKLDLLSSNTPYDVGNVNNVEQLFVRTLEVVDGEGNTNPEVTLLLTNYEGLETLNIDRSRADLTVEDLQGGVDVVINDMRGDVTIGFDLQNVPEEVNVSIREFGQSATGASDNSDFQDEADIDGAVQDDEASDNKDHDFGGHDADLTIDDGVATVNLTDAGTTGFESDLSIAGGFSTLNIDGGEEGLSLTIHDVNSSAATHNEFDVPTYGEDGVTVDATEFAGDLTIDADAVNVLNTGVGDDIITTDMSYGGDIDAGNGDNTVTIGSSVDQSYLDGEDEVTPQDDLLAGGSITTGSGVDLVRIDDDAAGSISTGASGDTVEIGANVGADSGLDAYQGGWGSGDLESTGSVDTGAGADTVLVRDDVKGSIDTGLAADTAADGDTVTIGDDVYITGSITTGAGADTIVVGDDAEASHYMAGDITTGSENDDVTVKGDVTGEWQNHATITTETGDDVVSIEGALLDDSDVSTGEGNDDVTIGNGIQNSQWVGFSTDALVNLGAGNDELVVTGNVNGDIDAGTGNDDIQINDGSIGGSSNIAGGAGESDTLSLVDIGEDSTDLSIVAGDITSIETLNLVDYVASGEDDFNVELNAFDGDLNEVNIVKFGSGNSEANLYNVAGEQISISAQDNVPETDVTLNVTSAASSLAVSLESNIDGNHFAEGEGGLIEPSVVTGNTDFDVVINDDSETPIADLNLANNGEAVSDDVFWDGYEKGRTVTLDGEDFDGTLTITGDMTNDRAGYAESDDLRRLNQQDGNLLLVSGIAADTIEAGEYAGDLNLVLADDESHTITLGSGDDVVNLLGDTLDVNDDIDFGDGVDRLIVNDDTQTTGDDSDEVFGDLISLEELEVRGDGGIGGGEVDNLLEVSLDDDALDSDIARVIVDADGATDANVLLDIGADWENRDLRVDVFNGQVEINNDSNNDLTIFTDASEGGRDITIDNNDGGTSTVYVGIDAGEDATIASGNAYDYAQYDENTENPEFGYGNDGEVELDAKSGSITSITLLDNAKDTESENGNIEVTVADAWAKDEDTEDADVPSLIIDASDISNEDGNDNTGGLTLRGGLEDDATLTVTGTDNDDHILGGQLGDTLIGGLGDDEIIGDPTGPVLPGVQQVSTVVFTDEVLDAGDVYTVTLNGVDYTYSADGEDDIDNVGAALADAINLDGDLDASYDADTDTLTVTGNDTYMDELTGDTLAAGESFSIGASVLNGPLAEVEVLTLADEPYDAGDELSAYIDYYYGNFTVTVTLEADSTRAEAVAALIDAINNDSNAMAAGFSATTGAAGEVVISAPADGYTDFYVTGSVVDATQDGYQFTLAGMTSGFVSVTVDNVAYGVAYNVGGNNATATDLAAVLDGLANISAVAVGGVITVTTDDASALTIGAYSTSTGTLTYADAAVIVGTDNTDAGASGETVNAGLYGANPNTTPAVNTPVDAVLATEPDSESGAADTIYGGEGNNELYGVVGGDFIYAGSGNNYVEGGEGNDTIILGNGTNTVYGDDGDDIINIAVTNAGTNLVDGFSTVYGGAGEDTITLGDGGSLVYGGDDVDKITTGAGADVIYGGAGGDLIQANGGSDTFAYMAASDSTGAAQGFDIITGVSAGAAGDVFDFTALDMDGVVFLGNFENENVANTAIAASVTNKLEVVFVEYTSGDNEGWIYADTNYNGTIDTADLAIKVVGLSGDLTAANFADVI